MFPHRQARYPRLVLGLARQAVRRGELAFIVLASMSCTKAAGPEPSSSPPPQIFVEQAEIEGVDEDWLSNDMEELCVLPADRPDSLEEACSELPRSFDAFMERMFEGDTLARWRAAKEVQLELLGAMCTKADSLDVAACQIHALRHASVDLRRMASELLVGCQERYGPLGSD